jgi:hypothetical protein
VERTTKPDLRGTRTPPLVLGAFRITTSPVGLYLVEIRGAPLCLKKERTVRYDSMKRVAGPYAVPRLEELLADPDQVRVLDAARAETDIRAHQRPDRLLNVSQAAEKP